MTKQELLISHINRLSEDEISSLLDAVTIILQDKEFTPKPACPHCAAQSVIRYGFKCKKQRFLCKNCGHTFVPTTNTIVANSHFPDSVWKEIIADTLHGNAIDFSAKRLCLYHQSVFHMRHKILMALQELPETADVCLGNVSEFDETFVPDCYKGKELDTGIGRKPRKHGAKALKRGISSEYLCICTGIQRKGEAFATTVNRAKPSAKELVSIFEGHIGDGTLALCDGLRSYHALPGIANCTVRDCVNQEGDDAHFFNLNTVEYYPPWEPPVSRFRATRKWYFPPSEPPQHIVAAHIFDFTINLLIVILGELLMQYHQIIYREVFLCLRRQKSEVFWNFWEKI